MPLWICKLYARINFLACSRQKPGKTEKERSVLLGQSLSWSLSESLLLPKGVDSASPSFHTPLFTHTRHLFQLHSLHQLSCLSGIFLMYFNSLIWHKMRCFSGGSYFSLAHQEKQPQQGINNCQSQHVWPGMTAKSLSCAPEMYLNSLEPLSHTKL